MMLTMHCCCEHFSFLLVHFYQRNSKATFALMDACAVSLCHSSLRCSLFIFTERQGIPGSREDHGKFNINIYVTLTMSLRRIMFCATMTDLTNGTITTQKWTYS